MSDSPTFNYANSDHVHDAAEATPDAPAGTALDGVVADAQKPFNPMGEPQKSAEQSTDDLSPEVRAIREARKAEGWFGDNAQKVYAQAIPDGIDKPEVVREWREVMA